MAENRSIPRNRALKTAKIILNKKQSVIDCVIRDLSLTGAKLKMATATTVPSNFELLLVAEDKIVPVRCQWQKGHMVGVAFIGDSSSRKVKC